MAIGYMGSHREWQDRQDLDLDQLALDLDQLFAPEPERHAEAPTVIFTQPVDRTAQLFADEPSPWDERSVRFTDAPAPPRARTIDPAAQPYKPRWKRKASASEAILRLLQAAAGLVLFISILVLLLMPNGNRGEELQSSTATRRVPRAQTANPAPAGTRDVTPSDSSGMLPPAARSAGATPATGQVASAPPRAAPPPQQPRVPAPHPGPANAVVVATRAPGSGPESPTPARFAPVPDVRSLDADTAAVFGQPVAPPPAEVPPTVVARERGLIPREESSPRPGPTGTSGTSSATDLRGIERDKVRAVLSGYERAYSELDAAAAARVYPAIDRKALSRAFSTLNSQQILFEDCRIEVVQSTAQATCAGTASWTPKVGGGSREEARRWHFDLRQVSGDWQIGAVKVQ